MAESTPHNGRYVLCIWSCFFAVPFQDGATELDFDVLIMTGLLVFAVQPVPAPLSTVRRTPKRIKFVTELVRPRTRSFGKAENFSAR